MSSFVDTYLVLIAVF
jgi:MFS transporter, DHA1 family, multidrug resistance protein